MTPSLETRIQVLTAERDEYQKAAVRTAVNCKAENDKLKTERDALLAANKDLIAWFDALKIDHDKLLAAGKLALEALGSMADDLNKSLMLGGNTPFTPSTTSEARGAIAALLRAGVE